MASDSTETLEQWAARVAPTLDADGWRKAEKNARPGKSSHRYHLASATRARALLAYRDKVAASLSDEQVRAVLLGGEDLKRADGFEDMRDELEIVDGDCELTDFGDEIARVLRETTDG